MSSVNKVILIGHLGADPEVRSFQNGGKVCNMRLATSERWKDKGSGELRERTEWHSVVVTGDGLVRIAEQYLRKGSRIYVEGKLQTRKWQDQSGNDRYATEVVVGFGGVLVMLDTQGGSSRQSAGQARQPSGPQNTAPADFDDEIPFLMWKGQDMQQFWMVQATALRGFATHRVPLRRMKHGALRGKIQAPCSTLWKRSLRTGRSTSSALPSAAR